LIHDRLNAKEFGLLLQLSIFGEVLWQVQLLVSQEIQNVTKQRTIPVNEDALFVIGGVWYVSADHTTEH